LVLPKLIDEYHGVVFVHFGLLPRCQIFIKLKKPICLLFFPIRIQTAQLEELSAELMVVMRGTEKLINCVSDSVLSEAVIGISCSSKIHGLLFRNKRVIDWVKATKKVSSIHVLLLKILSLSNIKSQPRVIEFLDEPLGKRLTKSIME